MENVRCSEIMKVGYWSGSMRWVTFSTSNNLWTKIYQRWWVHHSEGCKGLSNLSCDAFAHSLRRHCDQHGEDKGSLNTVCVIELADSCIWQLRLWFMLSENRIYYSGVCARMLHNITRHNVVPIKVLMLVSVHYWKQSLEAFACHLAAQLRQLFCLSVRKKKKKSS